MEKARFFYAARSTMGVNFTYDSPCWYAYRFESAKARDAWVDEHEYKDSNRVAEAVSRKIAMKIIGFKTSSFADGIIFEADPADPFLCFRFR